MTVNLDSARLTARSNANTRELEVILKVSNGGKGPIEFHRWSDPEIAVELKDQFKNYYARTVEQAEAVAINPQHTITETLYFEPPQDRADLELHLPIPGTQDAFRISIPSTSIDRRLPRLIANPPTVVEPKAPFTVPGSDPLKEARLRSAVMSDLLSGVSAIKNRAMYMNSNDATSFKNREYKALIKSIAKKHKLTEERVKEIVGP
jgi:hypothetical protein